MAAEERVKSYQRTTKSGKVITVKEHTRVGNTEAAQAALQAPGRPPLAAKAGSFANGRSIPNVWVSKSPESSGPGEGEEDPAGSKTADDVAEDIIRELLPEGGAESREQEIAQIAGELSLSDKSHRVINAAAQSLSALTVKLADG